MHRLLINVTNVDILGISWFTYTDINECSNRPCEQNCTNIIGTYVCACIEGYELDSDGHLCNGN